MKLKPCPFCGSDKVKMCAGYDAIFHYVECEVCQAGAGFRDNEAQTIKDWNTRPAEQELLEALKWFLEPDHPIGSHAEHVYIFREKAKQLIEKYEVIK